MHRFLRKIVLAVMLLFLISGMTGCSFHYDRGEAAEWFTENIVDTQIAVSKEYTERKNEEGSVDRVWTAYLPALPEVKFELISHTSHGLFVSHSMQSTYYREIGKYYLQHYRSENPDCLSLLDISDQDTEMLYISGIYDDLNELDEMCTQMKLLADYTSAQELPCEIRYALSYREPQTLLNAVNPAEAVHPDTYVFETNDIWSLKESAQEAFAEYAAAYRLELDQISGMELEEAVERCKSYQFTVTRPDGTEVCYPELILRYSDSMTFGCMYEVLKREGNFQVSGTPEAFSFTAADGSVCSFSYDYTCPPAYSSDTFPYGSEAFYYVCDGTEIILTDRPFIDKEQFYELTGLTYQKM